MMGLLLLIPAARKEQRASDPPAAAGAESGTAAGGVEKEKKEEGEVAIFFRVYDAIRAPHMVEQDKSRMCEKLMSARIVYLGEAEQVPD